MQGKRPLVKFRYWRQWDLREGRKTTLTGRPICSGADVQEIKLPSV